jgi:photosystem II stability/assembly factor-like uncharacterized protein
LKTTNGGTSWEDISGNVPGLTGTVRGIHFVDINLGFISNSTGRIYKTTNGGTNWTEVYFIGSTSTTIYEIKFVDANLGYAIAGAGQVLQTTNGGTNWILTQTAATKNLFGLGLLGVQSEKMLDAVLVGGDAGTILISPDGNNWNSGFYAASQEQLQRASFPSSNVGYAVGGSISTGNEFGDILKTTDGGITWLKLSFEPSYRCYSVFFIDENTGYVGSEGPVVYKTTDGGQNWATLNTGVGSSSNINYDIDFFNYNIGFVCNSSGNIAKTTDGGTSWFSVSSGWTLAAIYDMFIIDSLNIYVVGPGGRVSKSIDGGASFNQLSSLGTATLYSIFFTTPTTGFIAASGGRIFKTTDGLSFSEIPNPLSGTLYTIRFVDEQIGWVAGSLGELYYTQDGGNSWTESHLSLGSSPTIRDIQINGIDLWVIATEGIIIKGFSDPAIPVELNSFAAIVSDGKVKLSWITSTELNNSGFELQRKTENASWDKLAFIPGQGTTTETQIYSHVDDSPNPGINYYRLKQIDYDGSFEYSGIIEADVSLPLRFALEQNYPNPFNPNTVIKYQIPKDGKVTLKVYDILGNEVVVLVNKKQSAGDYEVKFDAAGLSSGIYFYQLNSGEVTQTKKMILLR